MEPNNKRILSGLGAVLFGLLIGRGCAGNGAALPSGLEEGVLLGAVKVHGENTLAAEQGLRVREIHGPWAMLQVSDNEDDTRWVNFDWVSAYTVRRE